MNRVRPWAVTCLAWSEMTRPGFENAPGGPVPPEQQIDWLSRVAPPILGRPVAAAWGYASSSVLDSLVFPLLEPLDCVVDVNAQPRIVSQALEAGSQLRHERESVYADLAEHIGARAFAVAVRVLEEAN